MSRNRIRRPAARPTSAVGTAARARQPARLAAAAAAGRLRGHRDGALVVRRAAGAAAGPRPRQYAAMAAAEGTVDLVLPAERGDILDRNGQPLADSIDGLMLVGDPKMTEDQAPEIARFLSQKLDVDYFTVLKRLRDRGQPLRVPGPPRPVHPGQRRAPRAEDGGFEGLSTRRDAVRTYPAHDVASNLVGFMGTDKPYGGLEEVFNKALSGKDGSEKYEVGAGNRIPLGDNTTVQRGRRPGPAHDHRPRPAVVHPARAPPGRRERRRRVGRSRWSWTPRPATSSRWPTTRRSTPTTRAPPRSGPPGPLAQPLLRARLGGEGAHALGAHRHRQGQRAHQDAGPRRAAPPGPRHPRPLGARADQADPGRRAGQVLQRRHRAGLRQVRRQGELRSYLAGSASASPPTSGSAPSRAATCPTRARGTTRSTTGSPSASRSRSTPCR